MQTLCFFLKWIEEESLHREPQRKQQLNNEAIKQWNYKMKILLTVILLSSIVVAQNTYSIQPGVRNNQIVLELSNISSTEIATDIEVKLIRKSNQLKFISEEKTLESLAQTTQTEAAFTFDVEYNIGKTVADTIEFLITDNRSIYLIKQFILNYTTPIEYKLEQNYPNPFNPSTKIRYSIQNITLRQVQGDNMTTLKVYDILGNEVTTLVNEQKAAGYYEVEFNASQFASGVYIYRLQSGSFVSTKKMMVLK